MAVGWRRAAQSRSMWTARRISKGRVDQTEPMVFSADETCDVASNQFGPSSPDYGPRATGSRGCELSRDRHRQGRGNSRSSHHARTTPTPRHGNRSRSRKSYGTQGYEPGQAFPGVIGRTTTSPSRRGRSRCAPRRARPTSSSSSSTIPGSRSWAAMGPHRDAEHRRAAADGLLYTNMHTTALCSPTRSCIMTGRNHHSNAMSCITEGRRDIPAETAYIPFENGILSEILLQRRYNTYALGKWHLTPGEQTSAAGAL